MGTFIHERAQHELEAKRQAELTAMAKCREFHARPISPGVRRRCALPLENFHMLCKLTVSV